MRQFSNGAPVRSSSSGRVYFTKRRSLRAGWRTAMRASARISVGAVQLRRQNILAVGYHPTVDLVKVGRARIASQRDGDGIQLAHDDATYGGGAGDSKKFIRRLNHKAAGRYP
jgi:hypothetical protein